MTQDKKWDANQMKLAFFIDGRNLQLNLVRKIFGFLLLTYFLTIYTYNDNLYWKCFFLFQDHIENVFLVHINWEYVQDQSNWLLPVNCKELKEILHHQSELVYVQPVTVTFWTRNKLNSETHHPMPKQKSSVKYSAILPFSPYFFCPSIEPVDTQHIKLT